MYDATHKELLALAAETVKLAEMARAVLGGHPDRLCSCLHETVAS